MSRPKVRSRPKTRPPRGTVSATPGTVTTRDPRRDGLSALGRQLGPLIVIVAGLIAYSNSFNGVFILDDLLHIEGNPRIQRLWPLWDVMAHRSRPIVELSLAVNYALGGLNPWGYHALNLAVHLLAGLTLLGIVRRMLESDSFQGRHTRTSAGLAAAVATIWVVHPLQTEGVTYIIQRAESLMGLCLLLTLYCTIRGAHSRHHRAWYTAAVCACLLGMGTKEVMVAAPILVLLYDRLFLAASFRDIVRRRWPLYVSLATTWLVLGVLVVARRQAEDWTFITGITPWTYAVTQPAVIVHYLRLAFWPYPLVLDYGWRPAESLAATLPWAALVLALLAATVWALCRKFWVGFWGAWFFLILAPTSSILAIADLAFEHRLYLPLAAVVVVAVVGGHGLLQFLFARWGTPEHLRRWAQAVPVVAVVAILGYMTVHRNADYRSQFVMWSDVVAKRPDNPRAHNNLGSALYKEGRPEEAIPHYLEAIRLKPDYAEAHRNLAVVLGGQRRSQEAIVHYAEVVRLMPEWAKAQNELGIALFAAGQLDEAIAHFNEAVRLKPAAPEVRYNLGKVLVAKGRVEEGVAQYLEAVRLRPDHVLAQYDLGIALMMLGRTEAAIARFAEAVRLRPNFADAHNDLGAALFTQGRFTDALAHFEEAVRLKPAYPEAQRNLGLALLNQGRVQEAIPHLETALRLKPDFREALDDLHRARARL